MTFISNVYIGISCGFWIPRNSSDIGVAELEEGLLSERSLLVPLSPSGRGTCWGSEQLVQNRLRVYAGRNPQQETVHQEEGESQSDWLILYEFLHLHVHLSAKRKCRPGKTSR